MILAARGRVSRDFVAARSFPPSIALDTAPLGVQNPFGESVNCSSYPNGPPYSLRELIRHRVRTLPRAGKKFVEFTNLS